LAAGAGADVCAAAVAAKAAMTSAARSLLMCSLLSWLTGATLNLCVEKEKRDASRFG
jgi:hypothetical protein